MPATTPSQTTREKLLDAAEALLLQDGYDAVSVRRICTRAGANSAAVHYHFGSKEQLVANLLETRLASVWAGGLDEAIAGPPSVPALVDAILAPMEELLADPIGAVRLSLLSRFVLTNPTAEWQTTWFDLDVWAQALTRAIPGLSLTDARRRCRVAFSLLLAQFGPGVPLPPTAAAALRQFLTAGLSGPSAPQPNSDEESLR
ncbi:MAG: TetR/AcrR family transcriptional regulator [Gordonia sp. (in: high G+C Gram-positive bacteria)]|uniref:TetR/AcrR family transcriptional regulator n=1 Tax=Gordonia sp. (in: high G+C Gram-positive bacteria) TaxID=84139 RepID=UPI003C75732F